MATKEYAQYTMRQVHVHGGPGVIISGVVWIISALVIITAGVWPGMITLFFGGMAIYPVSTLIEIWLKKWAGKPGQVPDKGLTQIALLTLFLLFGGIFLGYKLSFIRAELFFAITAITIGLRYLIFQHIFGLKAFWTLGLILVAWGGLGALLPILGAFETALLVGLTEIIIGLWITRRYFSQKPAPPPS